MKNKKTLAIILIVLVLTLVVSVLYAMRGTLFNNSSQNNNNANTNINTVNSPNVFPLHMGSKGAEVKKLQDYLLSKNANCLPKYHDDGDWGSETQACVQSVLNVNEVSQGLYNQLGLA